MTQLPAWVEPFLEAVRGGAKFADAASKAGVTGPTVWRYRRADERFAALWKAVLVDGLTPAQEAQHATMRAPVERDERIYQMHLDGMTSRAIAEREGISPSRAHQIVSKMRRKANAAAS